MTGTSTIFTTCGRMMGPARPPEQRIPMIVPFGGSHTTKLLTMVLLGTAHPDGRRGVVRWCRHEN